MWWRPFAVMRSPLRNRGPLLDLVALCGVAGLALLMWQLHVTFEGPDGLQGDQWLFRGGFLLTGLVTTVAVIAAVTHMRSITGRLLGNPVLNWIGLRSYGLYLYHWPIYQFIRKEAGDRADAARVRAGDGDHVRDHRGVATATSRRRSAPAGSARWVHARTCADARRRRPRCGAVARWPAACWRCRCRCSPGSASRFAPLKQSDVAQSLASGEDSVTDVLDAAAERRWRCRRPTRRSPSTPHR